MLVSHRFCQLNVKELKGRSIPEAFTSKNVEGFSMPIKIILWLRLKGFISQDTFYYMYVEGFSMPKKRSLWFKLKGFSSQDAFYYSLE